MNDIQLRRIDMNLLMIFSSIVKHQKLSTVADELGLTRSAISHALSRLRDIFGDELFIRGQSGVQITARALTLAPKIAGIIDLASDALRIDDSFDPMEDIRTLRFGVLEYGAALFAPMLGEIMQREAPRMNLAITTLRRADMLEQIAAYKLDIAVNSFFGGTSNLTVEDLYQDEFVVVAREGHPLLTECLTRESYLAGEHIMVMRNGRPPAVLESCITRFGLSLNIVMTVPFYMPAMEAVARSDRLLTLPKLMATHYRDLFGLRIHSLPFPDVQATVSMISHANAGRDPGVCWFRGKVRQVAEALVADPSPRRTRNKSQIRKLLSNTSML